MVTTLLAAPAAWGATPCTTQAHVISLSAGGATPGTGTTATVFIFSVVYADTEKCVPDRVQVKVPGVGTYDLTGSATTYDTGVQFTNGLSLPVGTYAYSFTARSGVAGGKKTATLTAVSPASVVVTLPPPPTPIPTPIPTPVPTPVPAPVPTPVPTVKPLVQATPSANVATGSVASPGSPSPTVAVGLGGLPSDGTTPSQDQGQAPDASGSQPESLGSSVSNPGSAGMFPLLLAAWTVTTAGGLAFFLLLAPRRRAPREPAFAAAGPGEPVVQIAQPPLPVPEPTAASDLTPPEEADMPRWLRPSVQAARRGQRGSRSGTRRLGDS